MIILQFVQDRDRQFIAFKWLDFHHEFDHSAVK